MTGASPPGVQRLARFCLTTADAERLATFYQDAFGARRSDAERLGSPVFQRQMGVGGRAWRIALQLGAATIDLIEFDDPGAPYPAGASTSDRIFQHLAIVVADMNAACERLSATTGWTAISTDGPQTLPASAGGVTAFKFRDPEGHPLELLAFPERETPARWRIDAADGACLGIDHSAISVADTPRSIAFYQQLGLTVSARSVNRGPEQGRLDGLGNPCVEVVAVTPPDPCPHIELLGYVGAIGGGYRVRNNDIAATRLVLEGAGSPRALIDPDGHRLVIQPAGRDKATFALD
ncbi:MAG TPA: VOC family protein [Caulobacteraceae bacterium]